MRRSDRAALEEIDRVVLEEIDQVIWEENDKAGFNESDKAALEEMRAERESSRARTAPARHKKNMRDSMARKNDLRTGLIQKGDETGIYTHKELSDAMMMAIGPGRRPEKNWRDDRAPSYTPRTRDVADEGVTEARSSQRGDDAASYSPRARDENDRSFEPRFSHRPDSKGARRERHGRESSDAGTETQRPSVRGPESLPYTTAASEFVYGYGSVVAAIKADRRKFYNLYVHSRGASREGLMSRIRSHKLFPITQEVGDEYMRALDKASSGRPHNGVILEASPLPVPPITELKTASLEDESFRVTLDSQSAEDVLVNGKQELYSYKSGGWRHPLILYVDGVVDEGNLGAIARSAYVLGADAIITPTHHTANWSHIAVKASAGAAEAIPLFKVGDPTDFLKKSAGAGWCIYASDAIPPAPPSLSSTEDAPEPGSNKVVYTISQGRKRLPADHSPVAEHPTILMMGAEGTGLKTSLVNLARYKVGIPHGREANEIGVDSLNVSVAASILCYEMLQKPRTQPERNPENVVF
ncbi:uncharacterized protein J4E88_006955 [Alternaria novae-zelandiae]|uniref:uncharacterized protein n=1 Tax=Alternaria novae-zelandiae TaxID=430562 RepID=UPI0020C1EEF1|nr:uncharacterized protein J4E88_006955 [Alternaria novae-zelandiae]KAI4677148.1 hypothetical protein J4E88_006955 [Alternaria novae-zelandiae]